MDEFETMKKIEAQIEKDFDEPYNLLCVVNDEAENLGEFIEAAKTLGLDVLAETLQGIVNRLETACMKAEPWIDAQANKKRNELGWPEWARVGNGR